MPTFIRLQLGEQLKKLVEADKDAYWSELPNRGGWFLQYKPKSLTGSYRWVNLEDNWVEYMAATVHDRIRIREMLLHALEDLGYRVINSWGATCNGKPSHSVHFEVPK